MVGFLYGPDVYTKDVCKLLIINNVTTVCSVMTSFIRKPKRGGENLGRHSERFLVVTAKDKSGWGTMWGIIIKTPIKH